MLFRPRLRLEGQEMSTAFGLCAQGRVMVLIRPTLFERSEPWRFKDRLTSDSALGSMYSVIGKKIVSWKINKMVLSWFS